MIFNDIGCLRHEQVMFVATVLNGIDSNGEIPFYGNNSCGWKILNLPLECNISFLYSRCKIPVNCYHQSSVDEISRCPEVYYQKNTKTKCYQLTGTYILFSKEN
ncbi:unnamed protein product [Heterobilharzia americana]|nr:unnamed protein product [Heterobilharzia americana]CAH8641499.1 unnamed protein product [Heterobilharzia americana]